MDRLEWVKGYYDRAGEYWGPGEIGAHNLERLKITQRLCSSNGKRVLELGAGDGSTAAAMADAGYEVVAIEFATLRAQYARQLAASRTRGTFQVIEEDFYTVHLQGRFDIVCYWDGFGIGSDEAQRRLLRRIGSDWLKPNGSALLDVFCPWAWAAKAGSEQLLGRNHPSHRFRQRRRSDFDPVGNCFIDQWCPIDDQTGQADEARAIRQVIRCYSPADFRLLLEGTGLSIAHAEVQGMPFGLDGAHYESSHPLWRSFLYVVKLVTAST